MDKRLSEYLKIGEIDSRKVVQCTRCQYAFCAATENYKNHALMREYAPAQRGLLYAKSKRFIFREFYCPQCGTMLDMEVRLKGQPFVWDACLRV